MTLYPWLQPAAAQLMGAHAAGRLPPALLIHEAPGTGARTAEEPVAIRQSSYSIRVPSSSVHTLAFTSSPAARRPTRAFTFHWASVAAVAVNTCDSAIERSR